MVTMSGLSQQVTSGQVTRGPGASSVPPRAMVTTAPGSDLAWVGPGEVIPVMLHVRPVTTPRWMRRGEVASVVRITEDYYSLVLAKRMRSELYH